MKKACPPKKRRKRSIASNEKLRDILEEKEIAILTAIHIGRKKQKEEELNLRAEKLDKLAKELEERQQNLENRNPNDERSIEPATHPDHSFPSQIGDQINAIKKLLEDSSYKDKIIKDLHEELQSHNRDLHAEIVKPLLKNMIKMHERLTKLISFMKIRKLKSSPETYTKIIERSGKL